MQNIGAVDIERTDTSAGTGKLCILGHLGLVFIWSCFVSCLSFLLFYPASQFVALQKKLEQAKVQLERKATKPAKQKVSSLERKLFLASDVLSFLDLEKDKLQQKEIFRLLRGQGSYLNDSYLLVWVLQKKISSY